MTEYGSRFDLTEFVLQAAASFHDFPGLIADGIFSIVFDLNDRLYDHPSMLQNVENFRFLPNVEDNIIWLILDLIEFLIQINEFDEAPIFEER